MKKLLLRVLRLSPSMVVAMIALAVALGGVSTAAQIDRPQASEAKKKPKVLRGPRGKRGPRGLPGVSGAKGDKGDKGDKGETGPAGAPNPNATNAHNAELLDGKDSSFFLPAGGALSTVFQGDSGPLPLRAHFESGGQPLLLVVSGSGFRWPSVGIVGMSVLIDDKLVGEAKAYASEAHSHKVFASGGLPVTGIAAGPHTLELRAFPGTATDFNDFFGASVIELTVPTAFGEDRFEPDDTRGNKRYECFLYDPTSFSATIYPANDDDWVFVNCSGGGTTLRVRLSGGATMDVYPNDAAMPTQTNVTSFTGPDGFHVFRIHSAVATPYYFGVERVPGAGPGPSEGSPVKVDP